MMWLIYVVALLFGLLVILPEIHMWLESVTRRFKRRGIAPPPKAVTVTSVIIYPMKSCAGVKVEESHPLTKRGLRFDRQWMVVDDAGNFVSQRSHPRMALIQPTLPTSERAPLRLSAPDMPPIEVPVVVAEGENRRTVTVWGDTCVGVDQGDAVAAWIAKFMNEPTLRVVRMDDDFVRITDPAFAKGFQTGFSDGYPLSMVSEESLADLNLRLPEGCEKLPMDRFRPNIVVKGGDPYCEDTWERIRVGVGKGVLLGIVKPCSRCTIPTVDQSTGKVANQGTEFTGEPLLTLKKYRTGALLKKPNREWRDEVFFMQNLVTLAPSGTIKVGDPVTVVRKQQWALQYFGA